MDFIRSKWGLPIRDIWFKNSDKKGFSLLNIDYNFGGIVAPEKFKVYFEENVFNNLNLCHKDNLSIIMTYTYFYCENNEKVINNLKNLFPIIKMKNKILKTSFLFDYKLDYILI